MRVEPINCFRPVPERAGRFSAPPYDVLDDAQARAYVAERPDSFMAIDRPETAFDSEHDPYAPEVYQYAVKLLNDRVKDGTLVRDERECLYVYRLEANGHSQTGIVAAVSVDDYLEGTVRRHEQVREEKVRDRIAHISTVTAQTGPVLVTYPDFPAISFLVGLVCTGEPLYDFVAEDGVRHTVWRIAREVAVESICETFKQVPFGYIADGHHRAAAAVRMCEEARAAGDAGARDAFLAILYPASEMQVLAYNRVVSDTNGLSEQGLIDKLKAAHLTVGERTSEPVVPAEHGHVGMYAFGAWRDLAFVDLPEDSGDPTALLDASLLQARVLGPILGIDDPTSDSRIQFVSGADGAVELERLAGSDGVAFFMYPTSVEELMRVSDAGLLMPPKSTWFAPKPRSGLFLRRV